MAGQPGRKFPLRRNTVRSDAVARVARVGGQLHGANGGDAALAKGWSRTGNRTPTVGRGITGRNGHRRWRACIGTVRHSLVMDAAFGYADRRFVFLVDLAT